MRQDPPGPEDGETAILKRTARGAALMMGWRMVNRGLGLISTLILVRLLSPDDFGLMSLASAVSATLTTASTIGVQSQIIRSRSVTRELYDTGFTLNLVRGVLIGALLFAVAGPASSWFGDARMLSIIHVIAMVPIVDGLTNIGMVEYRRKLALEKDFYFLSATRLFQITTTVSAAFILRDYTALMIGITASRFFALVLSYAMHPYRPRLSLVAWREFLGVSFWTWLISIALVVRERADAFLIGRLIGVQAVGLYAVAEEIASLAITEIVSPLANAFMPGFAAMLRSADPPAAGAAFLRASAVVMLVATPAGFGLSLVARPLVAAGLGPQWLEAAGLIAVMGVAFIPLALGLIAHALLVAHAALRRLFTITALAAAARVTGLLLVGARYGLLGIAVVACTIAVTEQAVLIWVAGRRALLSGRALLAAIWRPLAASLAMAAVLWALGLGWASAPLVGSTMAAIRSLAAAAGLGVLVFTATLAACWWLSGRPQGAETDLLGLIRRSTAGIRQRLDARRLGGVQP